MNPSDIQLVRNGFAKLAADREGFPAALYERLFARDPGLRALFATDMGSQGAKVMAAIGCLIRSLDRIEAVLDDLKALARRHVAYGVEREHYDLVGAALLEALAERLGASFDERARAAWKAAYGTLAGVMIEASGYDARALKQDAA
jgi:hemoglobin-like flavoprotein